MAGLTSRDVYRAAAALWAAAILYFSLVPRPPGPGHASARLLAHFAAYAVLAVLLGAALRREAVPRPALAAVIGAVAYGALIEAVQGVLPWRRAEAADLVANALGALLAFATGRRRG